MDMGRGSRVHQQHQWRPVFVYVKDGKIIRVTPSNSKRMTPHRGHRGQGKKIHPRERRPFPLHLRMEVHDLFEGPAALSDEAGGLRPEGRRNCSNRGTSGYERISWDQALDMVANEIKRVKRDYGPGAIMNGSGSHHTWGHLGYLLSARLRFFNSIGYSPLFTIRTVGRVALGGHAPLGPEPATGRSRGLRNRGGLPEALPDGGLLVQRPGVDERGLRRLRGTVRRQWLKELGIKLVHIDPFYNHTAALLAANGSPPGLPPATPCPCHRLCMDRRKPL